MWKAQISQVKVKTHWYLSVLECVVCSDRQCKEKVKCDGRKESKLWLKSAFLSLMHCELFDYLRLGQISNITMFSFCSSPHISLQNNTKQKFEVLSSGSAQGLPYDSVMYCNILARLH